MKKILYVFAGGRRARLKAREQGQEAPMDFLCGVPYLRARGYSVDLLELSDLHPASPAFEALKARNEAAQRAMRFTSTSHWLVESIDLLNQYDAVVAGNEAVGFGIAHFVLEGAVRTPHFYFGTGMLGYAVPGPNSGPIRQQVRAWLRDELDGLIRRRFQRARHMYRGLIEGSRGAILFGRWDYEQAQRLYPDLQARLHFLPFAVDTEFWRPGPAVAPQDNTILFMGNDRPRDYDMVLAIARRLPEFQFVFVTKVIAAAEVPANVRLMAGDWKDALLSDSDIRDVVRKSALVILPLKPTYKPSGQSVTMQAMACGKPVMISRRDGFWEPENVMDREHAWFIHTHRLEEWCESIRTLMNDPAARDRIGANARALIARVNNLESFGKGLENILLKGTSPAGFTQC